MAEVSVTTTQTAGNLSLPATVVYTSYKQHAVTNRAQIHELHPRGPDDVLPLEVAVFTVTNSYTGPRLPTYVPELLDDETIVTDHRLGGVSLVGRGQAWNNGNR